MAIAQANVLAAAGSTTDAATYTTASATPTANRLSIFIAEATTNAASLPPITFQSGNELLNWEEFVGELHSGTSVRRIHAWAALNGSSPPSGTMTLRAAGVTMTGMNWYMTEFSGVYLGATALDSIYGLHGADIPTTTSVQSAPTGPYVTNDATLSFMTNNLNVGLTCERTEIADVGRATPTARLGAQWFNGDDSDGPLFSWTGSANGRVNTHYIREASNPPPVSTWIPQIVTTFV